MAREIKQKIVLQGEKEYSAALREANRNLKTLQSELKAETAELGRNATEQQKAEVRTKNLRQQIAEQEKVVRTYQAALKEVRETYGDNEAAIASYEQKLNNARTALANMKNQLDDTGDSMKQVGTEAAATVTATNQVAEALGRIGSAGDTVSGAIEGIFSGMLNTVRDAVSELWDMIGETAARANNWEDVAGFWNTDTQTIQKWSRAVSAAGNEFGDLEKAVSRIALGDRDKIFDLTGVSWAGDVDDWQYAMDVLTSLSTMGHQQRNSVLEEIFGEKRATGVMDLLNDWQTITGMLDTFDGNEGAYGLSDEELDRMSELYVQMETLEEKWDALRDKFSTGLGIAVQPLLVNVEGAMDGVAEYFAAEDEAGRQAALDKIKRNLEDFFTKLGEVLTDAVAGLEEVGQNLQMSENPAVKAIGDILTALADTLKWMVDNQDKVKGALETIFGAWLIGKLTSVASKLAGIVASIKTVQAFGAAGAGASAASAAAAAGSAQGASWGAAFGAAVLKAVPWLAGIVAVVMPNDNTKDQNGWNDDLINAEGELSPSAANKGTYLDENGDAHLGWVEHAGQMAGWDAPAWEAKTPTEATSRPNRWEALQDMWDVMREYGDMWAGGDEAGQAEWDNAYDRMAEAFGTKFEEVFAQLQWYMDQSGRENALPDADASWFTDAWKWQQDPTGGDSLTSQDLQGFRSVPAQMLEAAKNGVASGIRGIRVTLDGRTVGRLVAPEVSRYIAAESV